MELPESVREGLQNIHLVSEVDFEVSRLTQGHEDMGPVTSTLLFAASLNLADVLLVTTIEDVVSKEISKAIVDAYTQLKPTLLNRLYNRTFAPPSLISSSFKAFHVGASDTLAKQSHNPSFDVSLQLNSGDSLDFTCSTAELTHLLSRVKEATYQAESRRSRAAGH